MSFVKQIISNKLTDLTLNLSYANVYDFQKMFTNKIFVFSFYDTRAKLLSYSNIKTSILRT